MRDKITKVVLNGGWMAAAQIFNIAVRFVSLPLLLVCYGRENYGLIAIAVSIQTYLGILSLGTPDGLVKHAAEWIHHRNTRDLYACARTVFTFYIGLGLISAVALSVLGFSCAGIFHISIAQRPLLRNMFILTAAAALLLPPTQLITQLLKAAEEFHFLSKRSIVQSILEVLWVLAAVSWRVRLDWFLAGRLVIPLLILPALIIRWTRHGSARAVLGFGWQWTAFRPVLRYGVAMLAMGWCLTTFLQMRQVILGVRSTVNAVAEFSIVFAISNVLTMAGTWMVGPLVPSVAKALAGGEVEYVQFIAYRMTKYFGMLLCLPALCILVNAGPLISLYVGRQYLGLAPWLVIMMLCVIDTFLAPLSGIIFASGKLRAFVWSNCILSLIGIAIVWILAPRLGGMSAVLATVWYYGSNYVFHLVYYIPRVMKLDSWRVFRESFIAPVVPGALTVLLMLATKAAFGVVGDWATLVLTVSLGVPCYLILIWVFSLDKAEREMIIKTITSFPLKKRPGVSPPSVAGEPVGIPANCESEQRQNTL
jgi:O-antigen/teichoic acid export membrane protein